jgi:16S rRNA (adenine1518-N6/adenine1519-N6)-dimethyltransferase
MGSIRKELAEQGLIPRKKWGQHFLTDKNILKKVIKTAGIEKEDIVLEVGPGLGEMTQALAQEAKKVIAVEIDARLVEILRDKLADTPNVEIIRGDILKLDLRKHLGSEKRPVKVVANLPYQISTPLLFHFIESRDLFSALILMLQREVAERIVAPPGKKAYGPLSVLVQSVADISICFIVKPSAFFPPPEVESAVIRLSWKERPMIAPEQEDWFRAVVKGCLGYRRKTLANALKHSDLLLPENLGKRLEEMGIDPRRRPETLSVQEFVDLASTLRR